MNKVLKLFIICWSFAAEYIVLIVVVVVCWVCLAERRRVSGLNLCFTVQTKDNGHDSDKLQ